MLFLWMRSPASAVITFALFHFAQTLGIVPLYDLCIRATPKGSEAMGYSVMMSVFNIALAVADVFGSWFYGFAGFTPLIFLNAATTALILVFVPLLPRSLTDRREGEPESAPKLEPNPD
jgi:predicted MFS family arabinose efflux permease